MRLALIWRKTKLPSSSGSSSSYPYSCCSNPLWSKTKGIQAPEKTKRLAEEEGLQISLLRSQLCMMYLKSFVPQSDSHQEDNSSPSHSLLLYIGGTVPTVTGILAGQYPLAQAGLALVSRWTLVLSHAPANFDVQLFQQLLKCGNKSVYDWKGAILIKLTLTRKKK